MADGPNRIIRPEMAQNAADGLVVRLGGFVVRLVNTGELPIYG
jgi:hypothetical protein